MKNVADIYPLSPVQLGMLFHTLAEESAEGSGVYVNQYTCQLVGPLNLALFRQAWEQTVASHPVLRTAFLWEGLDEPLQVVREAVELPWNLLDWRGSELQAEKLEDFLSCDRTRGFDLAQAPVLRLTVVLLRDDVCQLVWSSHHLLFDGWSLPLIWQDMLSFYKGLSQEKAPDLVVRRPYRDFIAWRQGQDTEAEAAKRERFWRSQLSGWGEPTPLPAAYSTGAKRVQAYQQQSKRITPEVTQRLTKTAQQYRLTLNTLVQGAWALLLSHFGGFGGGSSGGKGVMYGSVVSGRPPELSGVENMVGLFINTLPVCVEIQPEMAAVAWLKERQQQLLALRDHEATALTDIQKWSDLPAGGPLFESIVVFENYPAAVDLDLDFSVENVRYIEQSNYPLALLVVPGESLELILLYDTARFSSAVVTQLLAHVELLLSAFLERPIARLCELPRLTEAEQRLLKAPRQVDYPRELTIHELIEQQVERTPSAEAVVFEGEVLTYRELDEKANALAGELRSRGISAGDRVALCLSRSREMIVCMFAVLKVGGTYIPLDPDYPASRLVYCLEDTAPVLVCTERSVKLPSTTFPVLFVDDPLLNRDFAGDQNRLGQPSDLAYIIYTSGSTGRPKGVMVSHRNLVHSTWARTDFYPEPVGRFLLLSSIAFDSSVAGVFWSLCTGGTLVISPQRIEQDLQELASLIEREKITHTLGVPTLYGLLLESANVRQLATLTTVVVAGEACSRRLAQQHCSKLPGATLYNEYGPTEATVWCSGYRIPAELPRGPVSIGRAIANTQMLLLDDDLQPVPTGAIGEIYVAGDGVSQGYLNQPERTESAFIPCPSSLSPYTKLYKTGDLGRYQPDGRLEWLGRSDRQVKIRGYRIELGEIEDALRGHGSVQEAVVIARSTGLATGLKTGLETDLVVDNESLVSALLALPAAQADELLATVEGGGG